MRGLIAATTSLLLLATGSASAAGSTLDLSGPSSVTFGDIITIPIRAHLLLDGVVCREEALVPVTLRVVSAFGVFASFEASEFLARIPAGLSIEPREASATLMLRLEPRAPGAGSVDVEGAFALPAECVAAYGPSRGAASLRVELTIRGAAQDAASIDAVPTPTLQVREGVPLPIILAGVAAAGGGAVVVAQRVRGRGPE